MRSRTVLLGILLFAPYLSRAQVRHQAPTRNQGGDHRLIAVNVSGTKRYTPQEIMAATDLHMGDAVSEDVFNRAVQTLGESGVFTNVSFTYAYSSVGTKLDLTVVDNDRLVPAEFENIVWFSDEQLLQEIRRRVPLFKDRIPLAGNLADQVSDALQALLLQSHHPGRAEYIRSGPKDGPIDGFVYSVSNVHLTIRQVKISGATAEEAAQLQAKAQRMVDGEYSRVKVEAFEKHDLLPILFAKGYLKAAFRPPDIKVQEEREDESLLDLTLAVDAGKQYKFAAIEWSGNKAFSAERLSPVIHAVKDQPVNGVELDKDVEEAQKLYATKGYMRAKIVAEPKFDDAGNTVSFLLQVSEGDLYRMGQLDIRGLDSRTTSELREKWQLAEGAPYDASYTKSFLEKAWSSLAKQVDWTVNVHEAVDDQDKTVDVGLTYGVRASR